jgi:excinuclease ABC subunit C
MMTDGVTTDSTDDTALIGAMLIKAELRHLPNAPGVYRMLDASGNVLYVGKAKSLKKRVAAYTKMAGLPNRIARMVSLTAELVVVTTATEVEALLLEANQIKSLKPRYNVLLKDDKSFPYIFFRTDHKFAQITKHRGARKQEGDYFGPFATVGAVSRTLNTLEKAFLLRSCTDTVFEGRSRACLLYQIKRCSGPCVGHIDEAGYNRLLSDALDFMRGRSHAIQRALSARMEEASKAMRYEEAALLRDRIQALTQIQSRQDINVPGIEEADIMAAAETGGQVGVQVFFMRAGLSWGHRTYFPRHDKEDRIEDVVASFLAQFYDNKPPPRDILINMEVPEVELLTEALSLKAGPKHSISIPRRGDNKKLGHLAERNDREAVERQLAGRASQRNILDRVAELFELDGPPARIEVYDNSHISGTNALGGMIVADEEGLAKSAYRKFNIKSTDLTPGDDYAMMREVMTRRFSRLAREDPDRSSGAWPDLVLIDGGAGQLSAVMGVLEELGIGDVPLVSIAKGPDRNAGRERFFMPGKAPFSLEPRDPALYYLQRLRDEAHRFAIGGHRQRRKQGIARSVLDEVPGIGPRRKKALLHHFGSAQAAAGASMDDLAAVPGISAAVARKIYDHFHAD